MTATELLEQDATKRVKRYIERARGMVQGASLSMRTSYESEVLLVAQMLQAEEHHMQRGDKP